MAHGTPDWGVTAGRVTVYQLTDLAEHAVRLGSIDSHDRRGDVIFLDDFEDGIRKWDVSSASGATALLVPSMARARGGAFSLRMVTGTAAPTIAMAIYRDQFPTLSALGLEISFTIPSGTAFFLAEFRFFNGTSLFTPAWQYSPATDEFRFRNSLGIMTLLANPILNTNDRIFHTVKMVVDFVTNLYSRIILNERIFTTGLGAPPSTPDATNPQLEVRLQLDVGVAGAQTSYVDDVIVTQNEPV